jgi:hypothetical protein
MNYHWGIQNNWPSSLLHNNLEKLHQRQWCCCNQWNVLYCTKTQLIVVNQYTNFQDFHSPFIILTVNCAQFLWYLQWNSWTWKDNVLGKFPSFSLSGLINAFIFVCWQYFFFKSWILCIYIKTNYKLEVHKIFHSGLTMINVSTVWLISAQMQFLIVFHHCFVDRQSRCDEDATCVITVAVDVKPTLHNKQSIEHSFILKFLFWRISNLLV